MNPTCTRRRPRRGLRRDDPEAPAIVDASGFSHKHGLPRLEAGEHEVLVGLVRRGDEDRLNIGIVDQSAGLRVHAGSRLGSDGRGSVPVLVGHREKDGTLDGTGESPGVIAAHDPGSDDADPEMLIRATPPPREPVTSSRRRVCASSASARASGAQPS